MTTTTKPTTIKITDIYNRDRGEYLIGVLKHHFKDSYLNPEFGLAPQGGSFALNMTTLYDLATPLDEGDDPQDPEKVLASFVMSALCHIACQGIC
jgi:hypothetical protein